MLDRGEFGLLVDEHMAFQESASQPSQPVAMERAAHTAAIF